MFVLYVDEGSDEAYPVAVHESRQALMNLADKRAGRQLSWEFTMNTRTRRYEIPVAYIDFDYDYDTGPTWRQSWTIEPYQLGGLL